MRNKLISGLLLFAVLIWGYNLLQFLPKKEKVHTQKALEQSFDISTLEEYSLPKNLSDPFKLKQLVIKEPVTRAVPTREIMPEKPITPEVPLPSIKICGIVSAGSNSMATLRIDGIESIVQEGQIVGNVRVVRIFSDSIVVACGSQKVTIKNGTSR